MLFERSEEVVVNLWVCRFRYAELDIDVDRDPRRVGLIA